MATKPTQAKILSLKDVREAAPFESEEERRVMESLEFQDPTGRSRFESVEYFDAAATITDEANLEEDDEDRRVENDLFAFTNSIVNLHMEMHPDNRDDSEVSPSVVPSAPVKVYQGKKNEDLSQADTLAANAGTLFKRFTKANRMSSVKKDNHHNIVGDIESSNSKRLRQVKHSTLEPLKDFKDLLMSKRGHTISYVRTSLFFVILPSTLWAAILFYFFNNPTVGQGFVVNVYDPKATDPDERFLATADYEQRAAKCTIVKKDDEPTYAWWILFLGVRQVITLGLARAAQFIILTYALKMTRCAGAMMGPLTRLFLLQAKGWPFIIILWAVIDLLMLYGERPFSKHWAYYQEVIELFNDCNPAGQVTSDHRYRNLLIYAICLGVLVAIKRFTIGLRFGKASYSRYAEKLSQVLKDILLISKVAKSSQNDNYVRLKDVDDISVLDKWYFAGDDDDCDESMGDVVSASKSPNTPTHRRVASRSSTSPTHRRGLSRGISGITMDPHTNPPAFLTESQNTMIAELIGEWEDLDIKDTNADDNADLASIVQFRASVSILDSEMPYSPAFGMATTRAKVLDCAQKTYIKLLKKQQYLEGIPSDLGVSNMLRFHTIALTAQKRNGKFDRQRCKDLVALFRPARNGNITLLEFCKSIDSQYKELRKLRASIANEGRMNTATEKIADIIFYIIMFMVGLSVIGIDPVALVGFLASFILGFTFMISGASSDYFRGLMLIMIQRPYDIGDRINVSSSQSASSPNGSSGWIVKDVTLYHTTVIYGTTQEYATISNGALSSSRIINAARSPRACLNFKMKFGLNVATETVDIFKEELTAFVKSKPREWLGVAAFRMTRIEADLGFIEYIIILDHRESWQQVGALLNSLAEVQSFGFTLSQEMNMRYKAPVMPVEMTLTQQSQDVIREQEEESGESAPLMPNMPLPNLPPPKTRSSSFFSLV